MKKIAMAALIGSLALVGCASKMDNTKVMTVEGQTVEVKVKDIKSLEIELAPRKSVCTVMDTAGNPVEIECLQYRRTYDRNFNNLSGDIQGFEYEPGFRYVLDIRQEAVTSEDGTKVTPVWHLNKIISKTPELSSAN